MFNFATKLSRQKFLVFAVITIFFIASGIVAASSYITHGLERGGLLKRLMTKLEKHEVNPQTISSPALVIIYSTPSGFEPDIVSISPGPKRIMVRNRTGLNNLTYVLTNPGKSRAIKVQSLAGKNSFIETNFEPEELTLTESGHPDWICRFVINQ